MRASRSTGALPRALVRCRERFEDWRQSRQQRRIPEALWGEAVRLARAHGVHCTAKTLRLNVRTLRERTRSSDPSGAAAGVSASPAAFVELQPVTGVSVYVIEIEAARARMRVEVRGGAGLDVESLTRSFLGGRP